MGWPGYGSSRDEEVNEVMISLVGGVAQSSTLYDGDSLRTSRLFSLNPGVNCEYEGVLEASVQRQICLLVQQ